MRIADSDVIMSSTRQYRQSGIQSFRADSAYAGMAAMGRDTFTMSTPGNDFLGTYERLARESIAGEDNTEVVNGSKGISGAISDLNQLRNSLINQMMSRFKDFGGFGLNVGMGGTSGSLMTYQEYEATDFAAMGRACTEDGRVIDFNIELSMTRSYMEYMDIRTPAINNALMDPLMVNVDGGIAQISDQKFRFDLDADGVEEEISMLGRSTGFLALDMNGDGIINDGRELFGAISGDGFGDLRQYDSDGNGWIDENDDIFDRLRVWFKNEQGEDELMDLRQADIGAIFLGEQSTEFSMYGMGGGLNAQIRSTGFFLKESGGAGLMQHVDLATNTNEGNHMQTGLVVEPLQETVQTPGFNGVSTNYFTVDDKQEEKADVKDSSPSRRSEIRKAAEQRRQRIQERKRQLAEMLEKQRMERQEEHKKMLEGVLEERLEDQKEYDEKLQENLEEVQEAEVTDEVVAEVSQESEVSAEEPVEER